MKYWVAICLAFTWASGAVAETVRVAVASNFLTTAEAMAEEFTAATGHEVLLSHGSTGQIYAQIDAGAPFDIFLSADAARPKLLRSAGLARETRTYALGHLVLASQVPVSVETASEAFADRTVALADPILAPYGQASTRAMERLKLDTATFRPILVANVGQVGSVFATGNADIAFVAVSQVPRLNAPHTLDLRDLIPAIQQDAARLAKGDGNLGAAAFWDWLFSEQGASTIKAAGYGLPGE